MKIKDIVEKNSNWAVKTFGDSWGYDAIMELYLKHPEREITMPELAFLHTVAKKDWYKIKTGNSHVSRNGNGIIERELDEYDVVMVPRYEEIIDNQQIINFLYEDTLMSLCCKLFYLGFGIEEIQKLTNKSNSSVKSNLSRGRARICKMLGRKVEVFSEKRKAVHRKSMQKFSANQVKEMRERYGRGHRLIDIAADYEIAHQSVRLIVKKLSYKNVA